MKKFESNHKDIEYCKASKPNLLYMNRQASSESLPVCKIDSDYD